MVLLSRLASPFVSVLSASTGLVLRIFGLHGDQDLDITEEEIRLQIAMSAQSGSVQVAEAHLLDRVFHFGDRRLHEVMVPRTEVVWLRHDYTVRDFYEVYREHPHSRFPVYEDSPDTVKGVVGIKDVLQRLATGGLTPDASISAVMREAYFVPETKNVGDLFREMQANRIQMAIAVDEFGGTAGIVTLEQLLEEMVGAVADELRPHEEEITAIDERTSDVDGALSIEEARQELGMDIPEGDYDTVAGFVLSRLGRIPEEGDTVALDGWRIVVVEMKGPKVEMLRVTRAV
jgi:putative hemolysin